jgi:hypothetical protein
VCPSSLSLCSGPPLSAPPSPRPLWTSARTCARHRNPQPRRSPTRPSSFLSPARACTHSPASFHVAPLSLALCPRRPTSPETRVRLPRSSSSPEATPSDPELRPEVRHPPRACFTLFTPAFRQFGLAGVWPCLLAVPTRCSASPTPSSAPALAQRAPPPLLELARALSRPIASPGGRNSSPELPRPTRSFSSAVPPSLTSVSLPQPRHRVRRVVFPLSDQLWRPRNRHSTHPPQLRRLHHHGKERRRPQPFTPPSLISPVQSRSHD